MSEATLDFITLRQPERIRQKVKRLRYIRDIRPDSIAQFRTQLEDATVYQQKFALARGYISGPLFFTTDLFYILKYETIVDGLREDLRGPITYRDGSRKDGAEIAKIITMLENRIPLLAQTQFFHDRTLPPAAVAALFLQYAVIWDSLYTVVVLAGIHQVETNYLIDAIRALHLLAVLRLENLKQPPTVYWPYYDFDAYEATLGEDIVEYTRLI